MFGFCTVGFILTVCCSPNYTIIAVQHDCLDFVESCGQSGIRPYICSRVGNGQNLMPVFQNTQQGIINGLSLQDVSFFQKWSRKVCDFNDCVIYHVKIRHDVNGHLDIEFGTFGLDLF